MQTQKYPLPLVGTDKGSCKEQHLTFNGGLEGTGYGRRRKILQLILCLPSLFQPWEHPPGGFKLILVSITANTHLQMVADLRLINKKLK